MSLGVTAAAGPAAVTNARPPETATDSTAADPTWRNREEVMARSVPPTPLWVRGVTDKSGRPTGFVTVGRMDQPTFRDATVDDVDAIVALVESAYRGDSSRVG